MEIRLEVNLDHNAIAKLSPEQIQVIIQNLLRDKLPAQFTVQRVDILSAK